MPSCQLICETKHAHILHVCKVLLPPSSHRRQHYTRQELEVQKVTELGGKLRCYLEWSRKVLLTSCCLCQARPISLWRHFSCAITVNPFCDAQHSVCCKLKSMLCVQSFNQACPPPIFFQGNTHACPNREQF